MTIEIRKMAAEDIPGVIELIREFAEYEKLLEYFEVTPDRLHAAIFGDGKFVEGLTACVDGRLAGYAIFYPSFASFRGQRGFFLEDIYISAEHRGYGLGEKILREIARIAAIRGFERIDFQVLEWNSAAISFYEKLGAVRDGDDRHYKFVDQAFDGLTAG